MGKVGVMNRAACALVVLLIAGDATAADCAALLQKYTMMTKRVAMEGADGVGDNSAPRETMRQLKIVNLNLMRQMNLDMMIAGKCPLPTNPVGDGEYLVNALECSTKITQGDHKAKECVMENWK